MILGWTDMRYENQATVMIDHASTAFDSDEYIDYERPWLYLSLTIIETEHFACHVSLDV